MSLNPATTAQASPARESACTCGCVGRARRYPTDLTDAEWAVLEPRLPPQACDTPAGGRPERHDRRTMLNAVFYLVDNGIKWRAMPADFPPWRTVYGLLARWCADLTTADLVDKLRADLRTALGRAPTPSAGCVDAQSVHESAEGVVPAASSGYDFHKKVNGRKRHILVDTLGLLIAVCVTAANVQDRDAACDLVEYARLLGMEKIWADYAYHGDTLAKAATAAAITIDIVPRPRGGKGFQVLPRRWVVERTLAWISRRRRAARDYERLPDHHETVVHWAAIIQMTRHRARRP
jgi:transposase